MALKPIDMSTCTPKRICREGANEGAIYNPLDACEEGKFDEELCDCIGAGGGTLYVRHSLREKKIVRKVCSDPPVAVSDSDVTELFQTTEYPGVEFINFEVNVAKLEFRCGELASVDQVQDVYPITIAVRDVASDSIVFHYPRGALPQGVKYAGSAANPDEIHTYFSCTTGVIADIWWIDTSTGARLDFAEDTADFYSCVP